jgi:hypothetical protein
VPELLSPSSSGTSIGYDPSRNMLQLHLKIGADEGRQTSSEHGSTGAHFNGMEENRPEKDHLQLSSLHLHPEAGNWQASKTMELLEKSVSPTERLYRRAISITPPKATTIMTKTRLGFGGLQFSPFEVLGVNLDEASLKRAELLGFNAEPLPPSVQDGTRIARLTLPPSLDAIRGQELLSREMPGHRFELNKIYRIYRAAMKDDLLAPAPREPGTGAGCDSERCFARTLINWQDGFGACARGLRIGVIDTEFDSGHPTFKGRHIHRNSFAPDNRPAAPDWHGTGVLALLAGGPASGTPGLVPDAEFFAANIFFAEDSGAMATDTISLLKALEWMRANDVKLINMSFAGPRDELVKDAIEDLSSRGVVLVAAAGNEGPAAPPAFPAAYPQVIAVTAVTKELRNYRYANRGNHIDVAAPGVDIWTAVPEGREGLHSGTSFAAPHVTGIIALLPRNSLARGKEELLAGLPVKDLGSPGRDPIYGRGLLAAPSSCTPPADTLASAAR